MCVFLDHLSGSFVLSADFQILCLLSSRGLPSVIFSFCAHNQCQNKRRRVCKQDCDRALLIHLQIIFSIHRFIVLSVKYQEVGLVDNADSFPKRCPETNTDLLSCDTKSSKPLDLSTWNQQIFVNSCYFPPHFDTALALFSEHLLAC